MGRDIMKVEGSNCTVSRPDEHRVTVMPIVATSIVHSTCHATNLVVWTFQELGFRPPSKLFLLSPLR